MLQVGPQRPEQRGPEQDAAEQHAHDRGLADPVHGLAQEAPDQHQRDQLSKEDDLGRPLARPRRTGRHPTPTPPPPQPPPPRPRLAAKETSKRQGIKPGHPNAAPSYWFSLPYHFFGGLAWGVTAPAPAEPPL